MVMPPFPPEFGLRCLQMYAVGQELAVRYPTIQPQYAFLLTEAWLSFVDGAPNVLPSQDPNRKEVLVVSGCQIDPYQVSLRAYEMIRDAQGKLLDLRRLSEGLESEPVTCESPLLDAFLMGYKAARSAVVN